MSDAVQGGYTYADLHVGMAFRSPGRTITDADLVGFAGLTGDYSELHTSDVYAKSSQFGRRVAHGMLGLAYAHGLMWARTGELRETAVAFLGISDWKFVGVNASSGLPAFKPEPPVASGCSAMIDSLQLKPPLLPLYTPLPVARKMRSVPAS